MRHRTVAGLMFGVILSCANAQVVDPDTVHLVVDRCGALAAEQLQLCVELPPAPPEVDVLFMMDLTNSMVQELGILKTEINAIMAAIRAIPGATDVQFGLISHEDYPGRHISCGYNNIYSPATESPFRVDAAIGSTDAQVIQAVQDMMLKIGADGPESYARCLWECGQPDSGINWRAGAMRICLQFGDNIPHDCDLQDGLPMGVTAAQPITGVDPGRDGVAGNADDIDWQDDALPAMVANGVTLVSIYSGSSGFFAPWPVWAEATGGTAERISTGGVPVGGIPISELAADLVASVLSSVNLLEFVVDPACELDITFDPPSLVGPIDVSQGAAVCVQESISVPQAVADNPAVSQVQCMVDVLADGVLLGRQTVIVDLVDNANPTITCPLDINVGNDAGACGATVDFTTTAADNCGIDRVECAPASGSFFAVGSTPVHCTAYDLFGNQASCSFNVIVRDSTAPNIICPPAISVSAAAGVCGQNVDLQIQAIDDCSTPTVACNPASGSFFPVGVQQVNCTATDSSGNTAMCSFEVTVTDNEAPSINCPSSAIVIPTDPGRCDAVVSTALFGVTADDNCALESLVCSPAAGSLFPVGTTAVNCTATDIHGNSSQCSFDVRVQDGENPTVTCGPGLLWPPNHQMANAGITFADNCDSPEQLSYAITIYSDEHPALILGAGGQVHSPDAIIGANGQVQVRAERSGLLDGRVYLIDYIITDRGGLTRSGTCTIGIPHDQGGSSTPVQGAILYNPTNDNSGPVERPASPAGQ